MALVQVSPSTLARRGLSSVPEPQTTCNVVWLRGEHDCSTTGALSAELARMIARSDEDLVVDLSGVEFMGSATVGVLVRSEQFLRARSRALVVRSPSPCARRLLEVCDLGHLIDSAS
jgi:anti-sigma B factor antagonist